MRPFYGTGYVCSTDRFLIELYDHLTEIVAAPVSLPKMPQHIFKTISNFSGGKMNDDVALLIVALTDKNNT